MTDYDIDIRSIDPEYSPTIPQQAGRDVETGRELHLAGVTVTIKLTWKPRQTSDRRHQTIDVAFSVDHDDGVVTASSVGDAYSDQESFDLEVLVTALEYGERAMIAYLEDVGPDYYLRGVGDLFELAGAAGDDVLVHSDLEVAEA